MKSVARQRVWWPGIDEAIEETVQSCQKCAMAQDSPPKAQQLSWPRAWVWERLHLDFMQFGDHQIMVMVDAGSKWVEAFVGRTATSKFTIKCLRQVIARFGLPRLCVTDNGTNFTSSEFKTFLTANGIDHATTAPGHPATNGQAENMVKTLKKALSKKISSSTRDPDLIDKALQEVLMEYRNTPHCTTHQEPSKAFLGRTARNSLEILLTTPSQFMPKPETANDNTKKFQTGDKVLVRDYRNPNKAGWMAGRVTRVLGRRHCLCELPSGQIRKCHHNQLRHRHFDAKIDSWNESDPTSSVEEASKSGARHTSLSIEDEDLMTIIWSGSGSTGIASSAPGTSAVDLTQAVNQQVEPPSSSPDHDPEPEGQTIEHTRAEGPQSSPTIDPEQGQATTWDDATESAVHEEGGTPRSSDDRRQRSFAEVVRASLSGNLNESLNTTEYFDPPANSSMVRQYPPCLVCQGEARERDMVQCDTCNRWAHYECVGVGDSVEQRE